MYSIKKIVISILVIMIFLLNSFIIVPKAEAKTINDLKRELEQKEKNHNDNDNKIDQTEAQINQTKKDIRQIYVDISRIENEIITKTKEIEQLNSNIIAKDKETKELMQALQISNGDSLYLEYIMGAESLTDFIYRAAITEQLTKYNNDLINQMNGMIEANKQRKIDLANNRIELTQKQKDLNIKLNSLGKEKDSLYEYQQSLEEEIKTAREVIEMYIKAGCGLDEDLNACANRLLPPDTQFWRPLIRGYVTSEYGMRLNPVTHVWQIHDGMDFGNSDKFNTKVYAAANGKVAYICTNPNNSMGNYVIIHHNINGKSYTTQYLHMVTGSIQVKVGQLVNKDTIIGTMGTTGNSTGVHLHFSIASGLRYKDYYLYSDYVTRTVNPRLMVNIPSGYYNYWSDRTHKYN